MNNLTVVRNSAQTRAQVLRPYQQEAIQAIREAWGDEQTPLAWLATGAGKTTILSQLLVETVDPHSQRALVFAHTKEIIEQIKERVTNQYNGLLDRYFGPQFNPGIGIVMGENDSPDARIVVATRQSLHKRRLERVMQTGAFDVVVIDEGHHVSDNTYLSIVKACREANPYVKVAGLTATPKRTDKKALGMLFTGICYPWTILDGIQGGYLSPATRIKIKTGVDVSRIRTLEGDYDQKQLVSVLDASNWVNLALDSYREYAGERQTLAFFPKVDMSREFVSRLQESGISAEHIDAHTPKAQRADILRRYQQGEVKVVANMGV
ncbi:MAG: DEAD/DEAH box helicase family protein, partial [Anaerolineae bacterium]|nr:DEAD/DEAH box helicase family protein [Anaerolineae bacterium]